MVATHNNLDSRSESLDFRMEEHKTRKGREASQKRPCYPEQIVGFEAGWFFGWKQEIDFYMF